MAICPVRTPYKRKFTSLIRIPIVHSLCSHYNLLWHSLCSTIDELSHFIPHAKHWILNILHQRKLYNYSELQTIARLAMINFSLSRSLSFARRTLLLTRFGLYSPILCNVPENGCARLTKSLYYRKPCAFHSVLPVRHGEMGANKWLEFCNNFCFYSVTLPRVCNGWCSIFFEVSMKRKITLLRWVSLAFKLVE